MLYKENARDFFTGKTNIFNVLTSKSGFGLLRYSFDLRIKERYILFIFAPTEFNSWSNK